MNYGICQLWVEIGKIGILVLVIKRVSDHELLNLHTQNGLYTVKILIEARAFIRIMADVEVGSGQLLEATVLE